MTNDLANAVRFLSIDAIEKAQSGHPGMPLGMADLATVLWKNFLKYNPTNPYWFNRDRFILSNGHGSMLLYALLHLSGYNLSLEELKHFRQLHSKTPGHPEHDLTPGVETTTGPLAQGLANAVGMAIAEKNLASQFNRPQFNLVDHHTYVFVGDGCLMEGLSHEVCSLAGTLGLGKLIVVYDDNGISIDGKVDRWFTDNTAQRFKAYNWQVLGPIDGHHPEAIKQAIKQARRAKQKPSLIICKTIIGLGSPVAHSEQAHGAPLGSVGLEKVRAFFQWPHPPFVIPQHIYNQWDHKRQGNYEETCWLKLLYKYQQQHTNEYFEFLRRINGDLPDHWQKIAADIKKNCLKDNKTQATRKSSQNCINYFAAYLPELLGGSADLTSSNNTDWDNCKAITAADFAGNYLFYGVREFGMAAIMNGLALHGGIIPFGGTFLVFVDYARNAIRLSALMGLRIIYVLTHDSIGLGEDGPTHQPIEHATMLRLTPNMTVWRPADLLETAVAWELAISNAHGPSCLLLSRQNLPALVHNDEDVELITKGAYIIYDCQEPAEIILIATGSEVQLAVSAARQMQNLGRQIRVVSMPCCEIFLRQSTKYQQYILPPSITKRIAIEAAATTYWHRFVGLEGKVIGIDRFGLSAPGPKIYEYLGITVENIIAKISEYIK